MRRSIKLWVKDSQRSQPLKRVLKAIFHLRPPTPPPQKKTKKDCVRKWDMQTAEHWNTCILLVYLRILEYLELGQFRNFWDVFY